MAVDRTNAGTNRDVQSQRLRGGPPQRAALANAKLPFGIADGLRIIGSSAQGVSAVVVVEGSDSGLAVETLPLSFGVLEMGEGLPGVAVEKAMVIRLMSASFMGDSVPPETPWVATLWKRRAGATRFLAVATFDVQTSE